ncbi:hypothetical protein Tco_0872688 [Tanacetum coccineum]
MPGVMDEQAKLGSVVFMCIMMTFLLPSLATMNGKELVTNIIALGLLVIQIHTGLVSYSEDKHLSDYYGFQKSTDPFAYANRAISITYSATVDGKVCSATSSASAVIGLSISLLHAFIMLNNLVNKRRYKAYDSDYKWSVLVILIIQSIGITLGAIALFSRFLARITFKPSTEAIWNLLKFYEVESCWTDTLSDWKHNRLYSTSSPNFKFVFYKLQIIGLTLLTLSQKAIVITCKAIRIIPVLILICVKLVFWLVSLFGIQLRRQPAPNSDIRQYVLQPQDDWALQINHSITLSKSVETLNLFIAGLEHLPVVTLATIALSLRKIQPRTLKNFLRGVNEGLVYVKLVEKGLNNKDELVRVQVAAERLWLEVEVYHKWLGNNLKDPDFRVKTAIQIIEWFNEKASNMETDICANSMRCITKTVLFYQNSEVSQEVLFFELSSMISDILGDVSQLTQGNSIEMPHKLIIEIGKESVHAAATLLGKTMEIINTLQARQLPNLNTDDLPFIDKWRDHLTALAP